MRGGSDPAAARVCQIDLDCGLHGDSWLLDRAGFGSSNRGAWDWFGGAATSGAGSAAGRSAGTSPSVSCRRSSSASSQPWSLGALANELAVERSPCPLGAATAAPCLVAGVLTVWMVADIDGKREHPDFSEILLESPDWGKTLERDRTVAP